MCGSRLEVITQSAQIIFYLGTCIGSLQSGVAILDYFQKISDPAVLIWKLASYMLRRILHGHKGILMLSNELLKDNIYLTLKYVSVNHLLVLVNLDFLLVVAFKLLLYDQTSASIVIGKLEGIYVYIV